MTPIIIVLFVIGLSTVLYGVIKKRRSVIVAGALCEAVAIALLAFVLITASRSGM